jgi:hypothetical protein
MSALRKGRVCERGRIKGGQSQPNLRRWRDARYGILDTGRWTLDIELLLIALWQMGRRDVPLYQFDRRCRRDNGEVVSGPMGWSWSGTPDMYLSTDVAWVAGKKGLI